MSSEYPAGTAASLSCGVSLATPDHPETRPLALTSSSYSTGQDITSVISLYSTNIYTLHLFIYARTSIYVQVKMRPHKGFYMYIYVPASINAEISLYSTNIYTASVYLCKNEYIHVYYASENEITQRLLHVHVPASINACPGSILKRNL